LVLRADNHVIGGLSWSPDGKAIVFSDNNRTIRHEQRRRTPARRLIYTISENRAGETNVVTVDGTGMKTLGLGRRLWRRRGSTRSFPGGTHLAGFKKRTTSWSRSRRRAEGPPRGSGGQILEHHRRRRAQPSPDGKWNRVPERS